MRRGQKVAHVRIEHVAFFAQKVQISGQTRATRFALPSVFANGLALAFFALGASLAVRAGLAAAALCALVAVASVQNAQLAAATCVAKTASLPVLANAGSAAVLALASLQPMLADAGAAARLALVALLSVGANPATAAVLAVFSPASMRTMPSAIRFRASARWPMDVLGRRRHANRLSWLRAVRLESVTLAQILTQNYCTGHPFLDRSHRQTRARGRRGAVLVVARGGQ